MKDRRGGVDESGHDASDGEVPWDFEDRGGHDGVRGGVRKKWKGLVDGDDPEILSFD